MHTRGIRGIDFQRMQILEEDPGRTRGFDTFEETQHAGLRGVGRIYLRSVHARGIGGIGVQRMPILEEDSGRIRGMTHLKELSFRDCDALEEFPSKVCTPLAFGGIEF